ncbi:hypothetical protein UPYG_G00090130 [Umbra pygmaea]|uniref:Ig-like domain-containing protein n=1 Tax=Umbra pygmaea TaxID=75934 RepID=A0ABD0XFV6_UMBPY
MGKRWMFVVFLPFNTIVNAGSGSHSLWAFVTYIIGETPFPEFTAVVMLDDVQVGYYDSNDKQTVPRGLKTPLKTEDDLIKDGTFIFEWMYNHLKMRLRLLKKDVSGGVRVTCLAYGFYPRHINLTLVRDDQPVAEQELTGGEVLPSGDGTYQMRKTLEVSTEELNERHHYSCTASHLSLDNKLDVSWDSEAEKVQLSILSALIVIVLAVILLAILICMKRRHTSQQSLRHPASSDGKVEQILLTSDSQT